MKKNMKKSGRRINVICGLFVICLVCTGAAYDVTGLDITLTEIDAIRNTENTVAIKTRDTMVSEILSDNGIELGLYDTINLDDYHALESGDEIIIRRGVGITVDMDGAIVATSTTADTVGEALVENGIFIGELDYTVPPVDTELKENEIIKIVRVTSNTQTREETVPFETIYKNDPSIYVGKSRVLTQGVEGKVCVTENVVTENGVEISREEVSRETIVEKVNKVVAKGTKALPKVKSVAKTAPVTIKAEKAPTNQPSGGESELGFSYKKKMTMVATAYSAFKKDGSYGITASGMTARYGIIAVDPKVIPLGTKVYVEGYGYAVAGDTGGVIKGNKIDLCFEKPNKELMAFGRKNLTVYILS